MDKNVLSFFKKRKLLILFCFGLCALSGESAGSDVDIRPVNFKEGRPFSSDAFENSIADHDETMQVLKANTATLITVSPDKFRVKIIGFTDSQECGGDACKILSLRRAKYVNDWLLAHGVSSNQLLPPEGHGSNDPLNENATPIERATNRRAEFQVIQVQ